MNLWTENALSIFLIFALPGFIIFKIYDLVVAGPRRDFSKAMVDVVCYSAIYYAMVSPLLIFSFEWNLHDDHFRAYVLFWFSVLFIGPVGLPFLFLWVIEKKGVSKYIVNPIEKPWDWFFRKKDREYWVIVRLKDGTMVGGKYGRHSYASSGSGEPQIYLETIWTLDEKGRFLKSKDRSAGALFTGNEMVAIEFISNEKPKEEESDETKQGPVPESV